MNEKSKDKGVDRREALKKMGKYAAYTAPVVMTILSAKPGQATYSSGYGGGDDPSGLPGGSDPYN